MSDSPGKRMQQEILWMLTKGDVEMSKEAEQKVETLRKKGAAAIPELIELLGDKRVEMRYLAADALGRFYAAAADAVPVLIQMLDDESYIVRDVAARSLGYIGKAAEPAIPRLVKRLVESTGTSFESLTANALERIGEKAIFALVEKMRASENDGVARPYAAARTALLLMDSDVVPILYRAAQEYPELRQNLLRLVEDNARAHGRPNGVKFVDPRPADFKQTVRMTIRGDARGKMRMRG